MKQLLAASLAAFSISCFGLQPADVSITADPAVTVNVLPRKAEQPIMSITVNPQDHVMVNGAQKYPINHHNGIAIADKSLWPTPQPGVNDVRLSPTPGGLPSAPPPSDWEADGAVRLVCNWSKMDYIDPLVYPGQVGISHHHTFFGSTAIDQNTTTDNIRSKGNSSCRGGTINMTGYWMPSMIDTKNGNVPIAPKQLLLYYKGTNCAYNAECSGAVAGQSLVPTNLQPIPHGLKMIAGDATRSTPGGVGSWSCMPNDGSGASRPGTVGSAIPTCQPGDELWSNLPFPECWDGKNLDSPDHKSHLAYMQNGQFVAGKQWHCPTGYPVVLPRVSYIEIFTLPPNGDTSGWRLASDAYTGPAGYSLHGDYMYGWDPAISDQWGTNCIAMRRNCGSTDIGNGQTTAEFQGN